MPEWEQEDAGLYWRMADLHERANAVIYREVEFALPHGVPEADRMAVAEAMARNVATTKDGVHPFTVALHAGHAGANWNAHVIVSDRVNDGVWRDPEKWFSRAAVVSRKSGELDPAKGGARKSREMQPKSWFLEKREAWQQIGNEALERAGQSERPDCRSYKEQGIDKLPQIHLGRKAHQMMQRGAASDRVEIHARIERANQLKEMERSSLAELDKAEQLAKQPTAERQAKRVAEIVALAARRAAEQADEAAWQVAAKQKSALFPPALPTPMPDAPRKAASAEPVALLPAPTVSDINHAEVARIADELERHGRATFAASINARVMMTLFGTPGRELLKNLEKGVPDGSTAERGIKHDAVLRFNADSSRELLAPKGNAADIAKIIRKENDAMKLRADVKIKSPEKAKTPKVKPPRGRGGR